jgi:CheY-like chemotaxis protein
MSILRPILLVHSDPEELRLIRRQLQENGVPNPIVALSGAEEAIDFLEAVTIAASTDARFRPCLLLVDDSVAAADVRQLIDWARRQPLVSEMKIVILSDEPPGNVPGQMLQRSENPRITYSHPTQIASLARTECAPGPGPK